MPKDSFIIYKSFYEPIKNLSDKQLGRLFRALFDYQIDGSMQVDADLQMAFAFFKNQMDIDENKYQKVIERNKQNGSKGGRPPKEENPINPMGLQKPKKADNDNDNDNDNDKCVWNFNPSSENVPKELPEVQINAAIESVKILKNKNITADTVSRMWNVFKVQSLDGKTYYASISKVYSHFINWIKLQNFEAIAKNKEEKKHSDLTKMFGHA